MDSRQIWINPDCGLKTRGDEAYDQLKIMMNAAHYLREKIRSK
jgi:methionine synthase II (cobalamin-independent)